MSVIQNQLFSDNDAVIFRGLESQRFCWRCCRRCRDDFGWFVTAMRANGTGRERRADIGSAAGLNACDGRDIDRDRVSARQDRRRE
jgi:hypothetical protein